MPKLTIREHERLRRAAREYKQQGFDVVLQPSADRLPAFLKNLQPDLIAYGPGENVVVEVKTRSSLASATELSDIAKQIENRPGWRFDLILTNPRRQNRVPEHAVLLEFDEIAKRLTIATELVHQNAIDSAMLIAWTSLEGVLRLLSHHEVPGVESQGAERLLKELYALGLVNKQSYERLQRALASRNALIHGYSVATLKSSDVMRLIEEADSLLDKCQKVISEATPSSQFTVKKRERAMAGKFELKKSSDGQFMFNLKAGNGEIILTSERYTAKASAQNGIKSVQTNAPQDERFERRTSKSKEPYFVLKAGNHEIIGTSEMYSSKSAMENGIRSVKDNAPTAATADLT